MSGTQRVGTTGCDGNCNQSGSFIERGDVLDWGDRSLFPFCVCVFNLPHHCYAPIAAPTGSPERRKGRVQEIYLLFFCLGCLSLLFCT